MCNGLCNDLGSLNDSKWAEKNRLKEPATEEKVPPPKLMGVAKLKKYYFFAGAGAGAAAGAGAGAAAGGFAAGAGAAAGGFAAGAGAGA